MMDKEEMTVFFVFSIVIAGFIVGFNYFGSTFNENGMTGNVVSEQVETPIVNEVGPTCGSQCLGKGCFDSAVNYIGYNLNICKCSKCTDKTEKAYYCHSSSQTIDKDGCKWERA